jgi:MFS family permease
VTDERHRHRRRSPVFGHSGDKYGRKKLLQFSLVPLVAEHSPNRERGFWASWPHAGVPVGNMLATVVLLTLTTTLSESAFLSWGRRVAWRCSSVIPEGFSGGAALASQPGPEPVQRLVDV